MILVDNETKVDLLNNEALATTIVRAIRARPDQPVTIGVHGDWGAGKSSVLEMIEAGLKTETSVLCLKFNGWRFQGFEDAKIALIEGIVGGLIEERSLWTKASEATKNILKRLDWLKLARHAGGLAFTAHTGIPLPGQIHSVVKSIESLFHDPAKLATKGNVDAVLADAHSLLKPNTKHVPDEIKAFRKEFDELLKLADIEQLIVLIDDLDRCLPDTAIETLEAVRLFLFTSKTAFVIAADEGMIEYAVRKHFPGLPETTGPVSYARNYLEKLIQIPFRIPALGDSETRLYVTLLLTGAELGDDDATFVKLIAKARELLKRPWQGTSLDAATMKGVLGDASFAKAQNALTLSDQIGPILASGTKGNPRQIKRFLNTLMLRKLTAEARGFGEDIHLPVLAKLMLAERFLPRVFDQIAMAAAKSPQGKCAELASLEAGEAKEPCTDTKRESSKQSHPETTDLKSELGLSKVTETALLAEWKAASAITAWAAIKPTMGDIDLRPYLFVTKDRKDYFGPASALGHLAEIAEQLLGPKLSVQALESDLKQLVAAEASQVFEALRSRIIGSDSFQTEPSGIPGMQVLVKVHAALQSQLVDLLETLPTDHLGAWVVSGWDAVLKDQGSRERFHVLLQKWSAVTNNAMLKGAASAVGKTLKGGR
jgi:predicted KAP-like P-loop ATPase